MKQYNAPRSMSFTSRTAVVLGMLALTNDHADGQMTLTSAAIARGFTLTTFASGFPNAGSTSVGPLGVAYRQDGQVLVTNGNNSKIYMFPDHADGQVASTIVADYGPGGDAIGLAQILVGPSYRFFMTQQTAGRVVEIDENGAFIQVIANIPSATGIVPFPSLPYALPGPLTGHLFVSAPATNEIWDVNPFTMTATLFADSASVADGMSFSPDGKRLYVALLGPSQIRAYLTSTGAVLWDSPVIPGGIDGTAIGMGTLTGYIHANLNNGEFWEVGLPDGPTPNSTVLLASGGSRGDFIAVDPYVWCTGPNRYPSLLVTQSDRIDRFDPPGGGWFGPPTCSLTPNHTMTLTITTDAKAQETSWSISPVGGGAAVCSGPVPPPYSNNTIYNELCGLAYGCYVLSFFDDFGDGMCCAHGVGNYVLRDENGKRIIDANGSFGLTSSVALGFCIPLSNLGLLNYSCDRTNLLPNTTIYCHTQPGAAGYQFWWFDPHGSYSRRILRTSNQMKPNNCVTNPIPPGLDLNVRVRALVSGTYTEFGYTCRARVNAPGSGSVSGGNYRMLSAVGTRSLKIYPNPSHQEVSHLAIDGLGEGDQHVMIAVYDLYGRRVHNEQFTTTGTSLDHAMQLGNDLAPGLYLVTVIINGDPFTGRLVIEPGARTR